MAAHRVVAGKRLPCVEDGCVMAATCSCGKTSVIVLHGSHHLDPGQAVERAFTCAGCLTPHWFTVADDEVRGGG